MQQQPSSLLLEESSSPSSESSSSSITISKTSSSTTGGAGSVATFTSGSCLAAFFSKNIHKNEITFFSESDKRSKEFNYDLTQKIDGKI